MSDPKPIPGNIVIAVHPTSEETMQEGMAIRSFIETNWGMTPYIGRVNDVDLQGRVAARQFDMMITLGGDGTMLRAGHLCALVDVPLLGINLGRFGFLMQLSKMEWPHVLPRLFTGDYGYENRMMLKSELWHEGQLIQSSQVINEVVVCRGEAVRPIRIHATVDGYRLASYVADGLIAATPTGSTAYALAAGGPIMPPELRNILIVAVAPHMTMDRSIILPEGASVEITAETEHQAVISVDGKAPVQLSNEDHIIVTASNHTVKFVVFQDPGYFYRNLEKYLEQNPSLGGSR
jgi:NAD+ kinase